MKDTYIYPAIFDFAEDGISIDFPDLPGCLPCAHTLDEASKNAREAMALHLWGMEKDGDEIPEPSPVTSLKCRKNQIAMLVEAFMPPVRERINARTVKKTLTLPYWLNAEAERAGVNFSAVLQKGLKDYLHLAAHAQERLH